MARTGVTREQVHEAAAALVAEGQNPTVMAVRQRIGGGSPNNITKWLAEWREANVGVQAEALPPVPEPVEGAMRQVWSAAWKAAQSEVEGEREALGKARKEIEKERAEMLTEISRLDGELEAAQRDHDALEKERQAHAETQSEAREARALAEDRGKRLEGQEAELRDLRRQLATAERERDRAQADNQRLTAELESTREMGRQAKATLDLSGKKIQKLEGELETARQAQVTAEKALAELRVEVATLKERAAHVDELRTLIQRLQPGEQDD